MKTVIVNVSAIFFAPLLIIINILWPFVEAMMHFSKELISFFKDALLHKIT